MPRRCWSSPGSCSPNTVGPGVINYHDYHDPTDPCIPRGLRAGPGGGGPTRVVSRPQYTLLTDASSSDARPEHCSPASNDALITHCLKPGRRMWPKVGQTDVAKDWPNHEHGLADPNCSNWSRWSLALAQLLAAGRHGSWPRDTGWRTNQLAGKLSYNAPSLVLQLAHV
jgi:hypothetical protein